MANYDIPSHIKNPNMIQSAINPVVGEYSRLYKMAKKVMALDETMSRLSNEQLKAKTQEFKQRLANGETLDDIAIEAFAVVREADFRVLGGKKPYFVQVIAGLGAHFEDIMEMKTGEGKTIATTMPVYLNALSGEGTHVITSNETLAARDAEEMGKLHNFLGLSVGLVTAKMPKSEKKKAYACDITYSTASNLAFDFLRDTSAKTPAGKVQRGHNYVLIDEVDSILIDEAKTPLILSMPSKDEEHTEQTIRSLKFIDQFVKNLEPDDYELDIKENSVVLTEYGDAKLYRVFPDLANDPGGQKLSTVMSYVIPSLRANFFMSNNKDYIIEQGKIVLVNASTGHKSPGKKYQDGLHNAIEAKEGVQITQEVSPTARISYQNFFKKYKRLAGMTGTAMSAKQEFSEIYNRIVVDVPTHRKVQRVDDKDKVFITRAEKNKAIIEEIKRRHKTGQPILLGTATIESSEEISGLLKAAGIPHNVLNAKNHALENEIISHAGEIGMVTVATNMAGRGTDIKLGGDPDAEIRRRMKAVGCSQRTLDILEQYEGYRFKEPAWEKSRVYYEKVKAEVKAEFKKKKDLVSSLGGLAVVGTERHASRRIDNQLIGRAGRQGDPGYSVYFVSVNDELFNKFGTGEEPKNMALQTAGEMKGVVRDMFTKKINSAQANAEGKGYMARKYTIQYDSVDSIQREHFVNYRDKLVDSENAVPVVTKMSTDYVKTLVQNASNGRNHLKEDKLREVLEVVNKKILVTSYIPLEAVKHMDTEELIETVSGAITQQYIKNRTSERGQAISKNERDFTLNVMDSHWKEHLYNTKFLMDTLPMKVMFDQQNKPIDLYTTDSFKMYADMLKHIQEGVLFTLVRANFQVASEQTSKSR